MATGSVVIDAKFGGKLGLAFIAFAPFVGVAIGVYLFGKISMAHFNPAVSLGFLINGHHQTSTAPLFWSRDYRCTLSESICYVFHRHRSVFRCKCTRLFLPLSLVFGIEVFTALLMALIYVVVYTKELREVLEVWVIGGMVGLDIFFLAFISGALNEPCQVTGTSPPFWCPWQFMALLDWATFVGSSTVAFLVLKFRSAQERGATTVRLSRHDNVILALH